MDKAITSVERGEVSIRKASVLFDVPRSTLHDRITGKVAFEAKPGPTPSGLATVWQGVAIATPIISVVD